MTPDSSIQNWIDAKALFEQYIDQPIEQSLQKVQSEKHISAAVKTILINLIKSQSSQGTLIDQADLSLFKSIKKNKVDLSGCSINDYRLIQQIGQGGMSCVYKAKRKGNNIQKFVALKLLSSIEGDLSDTLKILFKQEQITLSKLNHPHIISFHHGGISQNNMPFLVMDYIQDASTISHYVKAKNLTKTAIIKLIIQVAEALNYAHQNLIIHKDIKPNNVLIDQLGMPKVVDFGIASFAQYDTGNTAKISTKIFTPDYASPEQIKNENITANTDIFSLAALFLQLLSRKKPLPEFNHHNLNEEKYHQHIEHLLNSTLIQDDLCWILTKALQFDKNKRYQSMLEFIDDLNAYVQKKPISARNHTQWYLITQFTRRNPSLSLTIMAFIISASIGVIAIIQQKNKAQLEALKSQQVTQFLLDSIQINDPDINKGKEVTVKELLLNAELNIQHSTFEDKLLATALEQTIGSALAKIGQYQPAEKLLSQAINTDSGNFDARISLAKLHLEQQYFQQSHKQLDYLLAHKKALSQQQWLQTQQIKANLQFNQGQFAAAIDTIETALKSPELTAKQVIDNKLTLAKFINEMGKHAEAIEILQQTLQQSNEIYSETSTSSTDILFWLANVYSNMDPLPEDKLHQVYQQTIRNQIFIYGENHPHLAKTYLQYGFALKIFGNFVQAREYAAKARKIATDNFGEHHMLTAHIDLLISQLNLIDENIEPAIIQLENVTSIYEQHYGTDHFETNQIKTTLAGYYLKANLGEKALNMLQNLYALQRQQFGESHKATIYVKMNLLKALNLTQHYAQAIEQGEVLLSLSRESLGRESILAIGTQITLAESYLLNLQYSQCQKLSEELLTFSMIQNNSRYQQKVMSLLEQANTAINTTR